MMLRDRIQVFGFIFILTIVGPVKAQKDFALANAHARTQKIQQEESIKEFREDFIKASGDYKASLQKLQTVYENDVRKLTEQAAKWKGLYARGLISRRQYETTTSKISEAQLKVDEVSKEIAAAEIAIAQAKRGPQPHELRQAEESATPQITALWTTGNSGIDALIHKNGARYGVDPYLIYCVIHQESRFRSTALSAKGAQGLMQLMPGTAARYGVINANDPLQNIMGGTRYLKDLLQLFGGRIDLALAGYNAGEGAVFKYGRTIPPYKETRNYVRLISQRYLRIPNSAASRGRDTSWKARRRPRFRRFTTSKGQSAEAEELPGRETNRGASWKPR